MYMGFQPTIVLSGVSCLREIRLCDVDGKYTPRVYLEQDRDLARLTDRSDIATKSSFEPEGLHFLN